MTRDHWTRVEELYHAALDLPASERTAFLQASRAGETTIAEVESLLAAAAEDGPLDAPAWTPGLAPGRRIGAYEILSRIGAGGMGEVWRARDTRLGREVAIKVSATQFSTRFRREARAIAALNHPHICTLYDVGADCLIMEYVDGGPVEGPLPWQRVLLLGSQITEALRAAHAKGIIHRDLKPGNILLSSGLSHPAVKLVDFGIARILEGSTLPLSQSVEHGPVGTLRYMSPEQLREEAGDARSDIFSLGCVLYEWISGRSAFDAPTAAGVTAAILKEDPPALASLPAPAALTRAIAKCLAKDPAERWQSAAELRDELKRIADRSETKPFSFPKRVWLAIAVVAALAAVWLIPRPDPGPAPKLTVLTTFPGSETGPRFSPDGRQIAFSWDGDKDGTPHIYLKMIGESNVLRLTDGPAPDQFPAWSPDGKRIAFRRTGPEGGVFAVSALGGPVQRLLANEAVQRAASPRNFGTRFAFSSLISWSPDGKWLAIASSTEPIAIVLHPLDGGEPRRITNPQAAEFDGAPEFSRDGSQLAFIRCTGPHACDVFNQDLNPDASRRGDARRITAKHMNMTGLSWGPGGQFLVFSGSATGMGVPFLWRARPDGRPAERLDIAGLIAFAPALSPGGDRLVFQRNLDNIDIWRYRVGGVKEPLIVSSLTDSNPQFSPDGSRIAFSSNRGGETAEIWVANADGSNPAQVTHGPGRSYGSARWSPDGKWLACDSLGEGQADIYIVEAAGGRPRRLTLESSNDVNPSWSRDGRWVYFASDRSGMTQIWRIPAAGGVAEQITRGGGTVAFESANGATLFYTKPGLEAPLYAKTLSGGVEQQLIATVANRAFLPFADGIYYFGRMEQQEKNALQFFRFSTGRSELILDLPAVQLGLAVSPDRSTFAFSVNNHAGSDLMMIENFR